jgi:RNA polymerase sigma-70 factor, ECF subfamily
MAGEEMTDSITRDLLVDADGNQDFEQYRTALTAYCYRMLGSAFDAEDAVQEAFLRAWRSRERFEGRSAEYTWLYRIATNVCLDMLNGAKKRALPMDLAGPSKADTPLGPKLAESMWVLPAPTERVVSEEGDPADVASTRESVRFAFVAALQLLPARQRAVLILRDVLDWKASEVADLLDTTVASVNSALQRAKASLAQRNAGKPEPMDDRQKELLGRYVEAFENYDMDALTGLLHEDASWSMPPYELWLQTHDEIRKWCLGPGLACRGSRLIPVDVNGAPGYAQYKPAPDGGFAPWALQVLDMSGGRISGIIFFLDTEKLFPLFGLPDRLHG